MQASFDSFGVAKLKDFSRTSDYLSSGTFKG